ncbi:murein transglycosylase [Escherichia coli]|nr:murein transglycosylase [Escherichia coli]
MEKAKQVTWRLLAAGVCLLTVSSVARADSLDEQRSRYAQIKQAWDNRQMDVVEQMMPGLKDYPLYPYLEYRQITDDLMNQPAVTVTNFVRANPTLPPARTLQSRFVNELARREDWRGLLAFSPEKPGTTEAQCNYYYAKWNTGQSEEAWQGAKELWLTGKSQPNACDKLFSVWRASGKQDPLAYLERIRLAMKAGNTGLVTVLAGQMPADYQTIASAIISLANNPNTVLTFARTTGATDFTRQMAAVAFASVARQDAENARLMIPSLAQAQQLNEDQIQELRDIVAWRLMGNDVTDEQAKWRDDAIMRSQSTSLIERRVRMALGTGDRRGLNTWLARLPMEAKEKDEWRYWQADLLLERGREAEAKEILHQLMQQRGFYPMVAAQRIGEEYELKIDKAPQNVDSAWNPKVKSPVGASGLMQIMPGTATHTVKMFSIPGYSSPGQLLDPETNINIGTSYLQYVYQQFGNNRIFSSAAYNAGPGRVRTWLGNSAGRIDAVAFVESIPFSETRGYVKNVLAYDAYYRYFMGDKPTLMSATEWGRRY